MQASAAEPKNSGFTLIEVLVALVVLGMLFVGLTQGVRLGINAWNEQSRIVAARDQLDDTDRALRELLSHISSDRNGDTNSIVGSADRLQFPTQLPTAVALATRNVNASLFVDAHHRLILRWQLYFHEQCLRPPAAPAETELLSGVGRSNYNTGPAPRTARKSRAGRTAGTVRHHRTSSKCTFRSRPAIPGTGPTSWSHRRWTTPTSKPNILLAAAAIWPTRPAIVRDERVQGKA